MKSPLGLAACALLALGGAGLTAAEISGAFGDDAVDEHVVRDPSRRWRSTRRTVTSRSSAPPTRCTCAFSAAT